MAEVKRVGCLFPARVGFHGGVRSISIPGSHTVRGRHTPPSLEAGSEPFLHFLNGETPIGRDSLWRQSREQVLLPAVCWLSTCASPDSPIH